MIRLNVISRIDSDKEFFFKYLFGIYTLKKDYSLPTNINFIGNIYDHSVYRRMLEQIDVFGISELVTFTKKSIPISEIEDLESDYFLNFSHLDFIGYSSVECLFNNFKTIFLNIEPDSTVQIVKYKTICMTVQDLIEMVKNIYLDKDQMDKVIRDENRSILKRFYLDSQEKDKLINILSK